jgi:hypothetical protein
MKTNNAPMASNTIEDVKVFLPHTAAILSTLPSGEILRTRAYAPMPMSPKMTSGIRRCSKMYKSSPTKGSAEGIYKASLRQGDWAKMWYDSKRREWAVAFKPRL